MQQLKCIFSITVFVTIQLISPGQYKNINQLKRCPVKTINFEQGLLNNETSSIITDRSGFTWVSTKTGMQRFNGYTMENVNPVVDHDTINIDYPVIFFALQNGSIWISYEQGILEYNPFSNIFRNVIKLPAYQKGYLPVIPLLQNSSGTWCMYAKKGIVIYNENRQLSQPFGNAEAEFVDSILQAGSFLSARITATNGNDIFLSDTRRLLQINTTTRLFNYLQKDFYYIYSLECNKNKLYVASKTGLFYIDISNAHINKYIAFKEITNESLFGAQVYLASNNQLLVSINQHLYEFDSACIYRKEFTSLAGNPVVATGYIHFIYTDRFKRIWLMTNDDIKLIQNVEIPFGHYIYPNAKSNFVKCIYYDEQKHLLLAGCFNGGILLYDTSGNPLWEKAVVTDRAKDIIAIERLTGDDFLIETFLRGWFILNLPSKKILPFFVPDSIERVFHSNGVNWINNIQRINDSVVFIATKTNIYNCVFKNTTLKSARPLLPFFTSTTEEFNCFVYTANKTLWAATSIGLIYVLDKNGNLQNINTPGNYMIRSCIEDSTHNIWVGTDKGLYVYSSSGQLIKKIARETGLLNDCIYALLPLDNKPAVFASTNLGLSYVSVDGTVKNYPKELGLQENEFNNESAFKTFSGKFYFGGVNGITAFYPASLSVVKDTPVLNITRLVVNDSLYNFSAGTWSGDSILLQYYQNHIQLDIAANGLLNTNEYIYTYRLKEFEELWQTTRQPTAIRYTLEPGKYLLEINCSPVLSSNTIFNKKIVIIIYPPWWQTWWFRLFSVVCLAFLVGFIVWQYNRRGYLKKIRALLLQQEIQHERERISRDLHDNLGAYAAAIAANVTRVQETQETSASPALIELQHNSQSIVTQLNDTIWALNREAIALTAISDRFKIFLQKIRPTYPDINIIVQESIVKDTALSPTNALHLFRIMQEAVNNAVRHSNCHDVIVLIESYSNWEVSIIDDGSGISETMKINLGNGLRNIRQRAADAGWDVQWLDEKPNGTRLIIISASTIN